MKLLKTFSSYDVTKQNRDSFLYTDRQIKYIIKIDPITLAFYIYK